MQTFLPYSDFYKISKILDYKRLGKQRVEAMQILNAINNPINKWRNHPIVKMWTDYEDALKVYCNYMIKEWVKRGYKNTMKLYDVDETKIKYPHWLCDQELHLSHHSNLIRKYPEHYRPIFGDGVPDDLKYIWR